MKTKKITNKSSGIKIGDLQREVEKTFGIVFGRTPLRQRLEDISKESTELVRYTDLRNLKEEAGDLLATTLQLCNENEWAAAELIEATLVKIRHRQLQYKALGHKTAVGLLGGAMNPITNGHIKLAQFVLNTSRIIEEVWVVPCFNHLYGKNMATPEQRLEMCRMAVKADGRIKVCDYEITHKLKGETYHFIKQLLAEDFAKDQYDFSYIIGLDNANTFDKWVNYEDLERMMRFIVVGRQGVERDEKVNWYLKPPHVYLTPENNDVPECSSTEVREGIHTFASFERVGELIDPEVYEYIVDNNLYR